MHVYYFKKSARRDSGRSRRRSRYSPRRSTVYMYWPVNTPRTTAPLNSSPRIRHGADYSPVSMKEPTTSPPAKRKEIQDTDPVFPAMPPVRGRVPRKLYQIETQKLGSPPLPMSRRNSEEKDDASLLDHLKRLAVDIQQLLKNIPPGPRLMMIAILICLFLFVHILLQIFNSLETTLYLITGIIASIIVIYEFVKRRSK
jgi:hypothetical protein